MTMGTTTTAALEDDGTALVGLVDISGVGLVDISGVGLNVEDPERVVSVITPVLPVVSI